MLLYILFLILILSLEATIALPIFFLYLAFAFFEKKGERLALVGILLASLLLAVFYTVSWPVAASLLFIYHLLSRYFSKSLLVSLLLFMILNILFFFIAKLHLNYFYLAQIPVFAFYFYRSNFRKYAS